MPAVIHGYIQLAKRLAEDAPYTIGPVPKGWNVWTRRPGGSPLPIAFTDKEDAEAFIFGQVAIMGDRA